MFPVPATAISFWLIAQVRMYIIDVISDQTPVEFVAASTRINPHQPCNKLAQRQN
jgi:hypothetical protein